MSYRVPKCRKLGKIDGILESTVGLWLPTKVIITTLLTSWQFLGHCSLFSDFVVSSSFG